MKSTVAKLTGATETLTAAYGRNYPTLEALQIDFEAGKDFVLNDITSKWNGQYCSIRDFAPDSVVRVRFNFNQDVGFLTVGK